MTIAIKVALVHISILFVGILSLILVGFFGFICFVFGLFIGAIGLIISRKSPSG
jgi:hypothetical protein